MNKLMIAAATFTACAAAEAADFQIGVYCLKENARTEQHIKDIRDCHVDFVYGMPLSMACTGTGGAATRS